MSFNTLLSLNTIVYIRGLRMNSKHIVSFGPWKEYIADGVRVGNTIYLSGAVSVDEKGELLHEGDIVAQMKQAYSHIAKVLKEYGATMDNIVYEELFVTDMEAVLGDEEKMNTFFNERAEVFGGNPEVTQSLIQVAGLVMPELMLEIKVVAML